MSEPDLEQVSDRARQGGVRRRRFGARAGFGKRPALLVIDVNWAFCGERPEPILESIKRWRDLLRRGRLGGARTTSRR